MENEIQNKYLPIGTVVLLNGGTKKVMITGFCSVTEEEKDKVYDYTGCIYPEGYLDYDEICLFDHNQIEKVYHMGYIDEECQDFNEELKNITSQLESGEKDISAFMIDEDVLNEVEPIDATPNIPVEQSNINNLEYL